MRNGSFRHQGPPEMKGDSFTVLGIFFGINLVFNGASQLALGLASRTEPAAVS